MLARGHAALGDHTLSVSAADAALLEAKAGKLLFSESLTVRARALVGKAAAGASSVHWSASVGKERMLEVMGRMHEGNPALLEKLLLHEL